jgi:hypothetical protein
MCISAQKDMSNKKQLQQQLNRYYNTDLPCKEIKRIMGISREEFKNWVETHFIEGMNPKNYGKFWQLDHVVLAHLFDFNVESDVALCFSHFNIIPMVNNDNRLKSASIHFSIHIIKKRLKTHPRNTILLELEQMCENEIISRWDKYM